MSVCTRGWRLTSIVMREWTCHLQRRTHSFNLPISKRLVSDAIAGHFNPQEAVFSYNASQSINWVWTPSFETQLTFMVVPSLVAKMWGSEIYPFDDYSAGIVLAATEGGQPLPTNLAGVKLVGGFLLVCACFGSSW